MTGAGGGCALAKNGLRDRPVARGNHEKSPGKPPSAEASARFEENPGNYPAR
jgi:hypothetical protein